MPRQVCRTSFRFGVDRGARVIPSARPSPSGAPDCIWWLTDTGAAVGVVVAFGLLVVFIADHFIRPFLIGGAARLPFVWVLLGILGGVETFGLLGAVLGPMVMAALISMWRDWTVPLEVFESLPEDLPQRAARRWPGRH